MSELRVIQTKHKRSDARLIRRVVSKLEKQRTHDDELLMVMLYLTDVARRIDDAFKATNVVNLPGRPNPEPPEAA